MKRCYHTSLTHQPILRTKERARARTRALTQRHRPTPSEKVTGNAPTRYRPHLPYNNDQHKATLRLRQANLTSLHFKREVDHHPDVPKLGRQNDPIPNRSIDLHDRALSQHHQTSTGDHNHQPNPEYSLTPPVHLHHNPIILPLISPNTLHPRGRQLNHLNQRYLRRKKSILILPHHRILRLFPFLTSPSAP